MSATLTVVAIPHPHPHVRRAGFDLASEYVERCWTARLGCTSVALLRRLAAEFTDAEMVELDLPDLAAALGVRWADGKHSPLNHTIDRLVRFGFAQWADGHLHVPSTVPPLAAGQLRKVPQQVRDDHALLLGVWLDRLAVSA
jgi:hypothetical protein